MTLALLSLLGCIDFTKDDSAADDTATDDTDVPATPEWGYSGEEGPEHWAELDEEWAACDDSQQSPIDIVAAEIVPASGAPPTIAWSTTALQAYNPGYYIRYEVDPGSTLVWNGQTYDLVQFHFHGLSEHTLDGAHEDIEIHFVHERQDDPTKLAVLAVLAYSDLKGLTGVFDEGGALQFRDALALPESHEATALGGSFDLGELGAFIDLRAVVHYTGSLTTPPCTEGVEFLLAGSALEMLPDDVDAFHAVFDYNYRPVQPLNGRTVSALFAG